MITPNDIMDKLKALVQEKFPGEVVYTDLVPNNYERPSNLIELDSCKGNVGYGSQVIEMRSVFKLTTFTPVDDYHHSDRKVLCLRQMLLTSLFLAGYIKVADRAVKVDMDAQEDRLQLDLEWDYATVTVPLVYTLDRGDFENIPQLPDMGELHTRMEVTTYG